MILVTGGAGFIGSHLVRALLARGQHVRVFDNFSTGTAANLAGLNGALEIFEGDLRDAARVAGAVAGAEAIFHQAALVSVPLSMEDPETCFATNEGGTRHLLEAARAAGVRRVVLASTCAVYGDSQALPLNEQTPPMVLSPYAASKLTTENYAALYTRAFGLPVAALRYFNVYGPRQRPDSAYAAAIPIFTSRMLQGQAPHIFGDGGQGRDFVFVGDVVRANLLAAEHPNAPGRVFNVCSGEEINILDLLHMLAELIPQAPAPIFAAPRPGDIYRSLGDPTHAAHTLGFRVQKPFIDGLAETVAWMRTATA